MIFSHCENRRYAHFERLSTIAGLAHAFSTRPMDVSAREDARFAERAARRRQMAIDLGLPPERICYCVQVHRTELAILDAPTGPLRLEEHDAIITNQLDLPIMTFSADCPLVLVYDPRRHVVGMVHASWRCSCALATAKLIETMQARFDCNAKDLHAGIGPSAGPERYEVRDDVYDAAAGLKERERLFLRRDGRMFFDLWTANRLQLEKAGIPANQIELAGICTMTDTETFYSFRREGAGCGHFGLMASLRRR
ncbi:MAG: laccase domain-containing protein [Planctomycetes bacterium]|nr:laccase domain-containing protein [Planctomycetota bacterium]